MVELETRTPIYNTWVNMKQRCDNPHNPNYSRYGGRGITYDLSWNSYPAFYQDMAATWKASLQLDRKDNDGNYTKDNCHWATPLANIRNSSKNLKKGIQQLTSENVLDIQQRYKNGTQQNVLAIEYKISQQLISNLCTGKRVLNVA